jgi:hypothetical protein
MGIMKTYWEFISEQKQYSKVLTIDDLAEYVSRLQDTSMQSIAKTVILELYTDLLNKKGNYAVKKEFEKATDLKLKPIYNGKFVNEAEENVNGLKISDVWVVQTMRASDFYYIFTDKKDAEVERDRYAKQIYDYYRNINKQMTDEEFKDYYKPVMDNIKVVTLDDAIDDRISEAIDNATIHDEDY